MKLKELVWMHFPQKYEIHLSGWDIAYRTSRPEDGELFALCCEVGTEEFNKLMGIVESQNLTYTVFRREFKFTMREKENSEILELIIDGKAGDSHSSDPLFYKCEICGHLVRKLNRQKVEVDIKNIRKYDLSISHPPNNEIFVSKRLKEILERENVQGISFAHIWDMKSKVLIDDYFQLHLQVGIGEVTEQTQVDKGLKCKKCGFYDKFLIKDILKFKRNTWSEVDICYSADWFGDIYLNKFGGGKVIIISNRLYKILKDNKVKSFSVQPLILSD